MRFSLFHLGGHHMCPIPVLSLLGNMGITCNFTQLKQGTLHVETHINLKNFLIIISRSLPATRRHICLNIFGYPKLYVATYC
jgi:hypothetical protein